MMYAPLVFLLSAQLGGGPPGTAVKKPVPVPAAATVTNEDQILKNILGDVSGPTLLMFFRQRMTPSVATEQTAKLIRQLSDPSEAVYTKAMAELVGLGPLAVTALRRAVNHADNEETLSRARKCLQAIEGIEGSTLVQSAVRVLATYNPEGATETLLQYLPWADDETVVQEIETALCAIGLRAGKPEPALMRALSDAVPIRRSIAARVLCRIGGSAADGGGRPREGGADRLSVARDVRTWFERDAVGTIRGRTRPHHPAARSARPAARRRPRAKGILVGTGARSPAGKSCAGRASAACGARAAARGNSGCQPERQPRRQLAARVARIERRGGARASSRCGRAGTGDRARDRAGRHCLADKRNRRQPQSESRRVSFGAADLHAAEYFARLRRARCFQQGGIPGTSRIDGECRAQRRLSLPHRCGRGDGGFAAGAARLDKLRDQGRSRESKRRLASRNAGRREDPAARCARHGDPRDGVSERSARLRDGRQRGKSRESAREGGCIRSRARDRNRSAAWNARRDGRWTRPGVRDTGRDALAEGPLVQRDFEEARGALTTADAHRHDDVFHFAPPSFQQRVHHEARPAHAVRMPDGNRAAVDVEALVRNAELVAAIDRLHGEGLVELPQADVVEREIVPSQKLGNREHGTDTHLAGFAPDDDHPAIKAQGLDVAPLGELRIHYDNRSGAVRQLR